MMLGVHDRLGFAAAKCDVLNLLCLLLLNGPVDNLLNFFLNILPILLFFFSLLNLHHRHLFLLCASIELGGDTSELAFDWLADGVLCCEPACVHYAF